MAKTKKNNPVAKTVKKDATKKPATKAAAKAKAPKPKVQAKAVNAAAKNDKSKKAKPKAAVGAAKTAPKKPEKAVRSAVPVPKTAVAKTADKAEKKPKKGAPASKEAIEVDEPILEDDFGPDELAEYADEVEAATRDDEDGDTIEVIEVIEIIEQMPNGAIESGEAAVAALVEGDEEIVLTDAEGRKYCRVRDCDPLSMVEGYCRYHYLLLWKRIQVRKKILSEGKLERYVEELTGRYPDKYLEMIRKDLRSEKDFLAAIQELELDDSGSENEFEDDTQYLDEVRGISSTTEGARDEEEF